MPARAIWTTVAVIALVALYSDVSLATSKSNDRPGLTPDVAAARTEAARTLWHQDSVIQNALLVLGQPVNPVRVIELHEIAVLYERAGVGPPPQGLTAFRAPHDASDPHIYVNRQSRVYENAARTGSAVTLLILAGTMVHEQVHNTDLESAAYRLQADFVRSRLRMLSWRDHDAAHRHLQLLEATARAYTWAAQKRIARISSTDPRR